MTMVKNWFSQNFYRSTLAINYLFVLVIFVLNFVGHPSLQYLNLAYTIYVLITVALYDFTVGIHVLLTFCFLEGQGRVLWNYHPFFRIAFDLVVGAAFVRTMVDRRGLMTLQTLPLAMLVLVLLHFLWYLVQFFNPDSLGPIGPLVATKIYIFPFMVFLMFRNNGSAFEENQLSRIRLGVTALIVLEALLSLYQLMQREQFMLGISSYYLAAMRGDIFSAEAFRPFGTTFLPGAVSVYLFLSTGFLFLKKDLSKRYLLFIILAGALILITLLASQVRSATVKFVLIYFGSLLAVAITSGKSSTERILSLFKFLLFSVLIVAAGAVFVMNTSLVNLAPGLERWKKIESFEDFKSKRPGPRVAMEIVDMRLKQYPLGIGPGLTGAASSVSLEDIKKDPIYTKDTFWAFDNFYLSLIIEFGYGAIFYILLVLSVPFLLLARAFRLLKAGYNYYSRVALIGAVNVTIILFGNWGAIGLPYNPESFFFWFWAAMALNLYDFAELKNRGQLDVSN